VVPEYLLLIERAFLKIFSPAMISRSHSDETLSGAGSGESVAISELGIGNGVCSRGMEIIELILSEP